MNLVKSDQADQLIRGTAMKGIESALSTPRIGNGAPLRWVPDSVVNMSPKP